MMILNFQCRTDTAIWTGGYATPPAPTNVLATENLESLVTEDDQTLIAE